MSRYRASFIHLMISTALAGSVFGIIYWVWYPEPIFSAVGALPIVLVLVGVNLGIGPLLTLVVYKYGKPGLKFDLCVIALMQVGALIYGSYRLYDEKPDYLVFVIDRLEFASKKQIDQSTMQFDEAGTEHFAGLAMVFASPPEDPEAHQRYIDSVISDGKPDLESRPEFWAPWLAGADVIRQRIKPVETIVPKTPAEQEKLRRAIAAYETEHPNLGVLPIGGIEKDLGMLLDRDTLEIIDVVEADPWTPAET